MKKINSLIFYNKQLFFLITVLLIQTGIMLAEDSYIHVSLLAGETKNETDILHLTERKDVDKLFSVESFTEPHFRFAFNSRAAFTDALKTFLTETEKPGNLIDYQVVDKKMSGRFKFNIGGGVDYHSNLDNSYLHPYRRFYVQANFHNRLLMWAEWWAGRFQGDEDDLDFAEETSPLIKGWYKSHRNEGQAYTNLNNITGQISYLFGFGNLSVGRGNHLIGDNISGSIILNDQANEYGYFSSELEFGKLKLSFLHASLIPNERDPIYSDPYYGTHFVDKFLALHQLDYQPWPNLNLYFGEQVTYANRGIDVNYLLPHTFYRITEHNLHDRDSVRIYAGGRWQAYNIDRNPISLTLYGSLLLDELRKSEIFSDWWGNKYALQGGVSTEYLPGFIHNENKPIRTTVELTAVRPWTYTHRNYKTNFSHDGIGLGYPGGNNIIQRTFSEEKKEFIQDPSSGSNIVLGAAELTFPLLPYLKISQYLSYSEQGSLGNCWSLNYNDDRKDEDGNFLETAEWLEGDVTKRFFSRSVLDFSLLAHHSIKLGYQTETATNEETKKELIISYSFMF